MDARLLMKGFRMISRKKIRIILICITGLISAFYILMTAQYFWLRFMDYPDPSNPAFFFSDARKSELDAIRGYMIVNGLNKYVLGQENRDDRLNRVMKSLRMSAVTFYKEGTVIFTFYIGRSWFDYIYGNSGDKFVSQSVNADRASLKLRDKWYFLSSGRARGKILNDADIRALGAEAKDVKAKEVNP